MVGLSFFPSEPAVQAAIDVFAYHTDYYLDYAIRETFLFLKPVWLSGLRQAKKPSPYGDERYLLTLATTPELLSLPQTPEVLTALLARPEIDLAKRQEAVTRIAAGQNTGRVNVLLRTIRALDTTRIANGNPAAQQDLIQMLLTSDRSQLQQTAPEFKRMIYQDSSRMLQTTGYAALITAEQSDQFVWNTAQKTIDDLTDYLTGLSLLADPALQSSFYEKVKALAVKAPAIAYPLLVTMSADESAKPKR